MTLAWIFLSDQWNEHELKTTTMSLAAAVKTTANPTLANLVNLTHLCQQTKTGKVNYKCNLNSQFILVLFTFDNSYVQGSIVKIKLRNFVTYDYCEFSPGPQLNMIIGPNGTGKSTIVCAIALGLGGTPALLGRAKNIAEFVKTGEDEAMIQIELKRTGGRPNAVIQRTIQKTNNQSSWRLDGISSTICSINIRSSFYIYRKTITSKQSHGCYFRAQCSSG